MAASSYADQLAATKARRAAEVAARQAREQAQAAKYRSHQPIPLYGVSKGSEVYYRPGQTPGAERTEARGREISGYWDPRQNQYVPANWRRPVIGETYEKDGRTYKGRDLEPWMMPGFNSALGAVPRQGWSPDASSAGAPPPQGPPSGSVPLPPGQGPVTPPAAPPAGNPYITMPPPIIPPGGNKVPQSQTGAVPPWFHVQQDPMAQQQALAQALRTG